MKIFRKFLKMLAFAERLDYNTVLRTYTRFEESHQIFAGHALLFRRFLNFEQCDVWFANNS